MTSTTMEESPSRFRRSDEPDFNLREWALKAQISRENTNSRRFSASNIRSFREDNRSFRSQFTISSTASSPGYTIKDEIDPSKYSFTTALKALQARSGYFGVETFSPDEIVLNSKWNEAEKYICNPLSGEVPMECLSAKTLSGRYLRHLNRITVSAPLIYSTRLSEPQTRPFIITEEDKIQQPIQDKKMKSLTRDAGTQSTLVEISPSPASTPSIKERSLNRSQTEGADSSTPTAKLKTKEAKVKETTEKKETKGKKGRLCWYKQGACLSWSSLWMRKRQRETKAQKEEYIITDRERDLYMVNNKGADLCLSLPLPCFCFMG